MQLELLIEIKVARGKVPFATLAINDNFQQVISKTSRIILSVNDNDIVKLCMHNKNETDTVIDNEGNIIEDMAVILSEIFLENVDYQHHLYFLPCKDHLNNKIPSNPYLSRNGHIEIDLHHLIHNVDMDFSNIKYMTLEEIALEVLGRPTTIDLPDNHKGNL